MDEAMHFVYYEFEIPDPTRPILKKKQSWNPSGELIPFRPSSLDIGSVLGRPIEKITTHAGTYGMGGPGFFGLRMGSDWLVISIWGAAEWILVDDRLVFDWYFDKFGRSTPWIRQIENVPITETDTLTPHLVGTTITSLAIEKHSLAMRLANGSNLVIDEDSNRRPRLAETKPSVPITRREFLEEDDLRRAVFLSPTAELWIN